jgi:putative Mn2+ efflux pump MntP
MGALGVVAVTLGLDSARASAALALHPASAAHGLRVALAFGVFDGVASLAGLLAGGSLVDALEPRVRTAGALVLAAYALWLVLQPREWAPRGGGTLLWVPAALSLDNLGAGVVLAGVGPPYVIAALLGLTSCILAVVGFAAGAFVRAHVPGSTAQIGGAALLAIAVTHAAA